jgi:hypothetical protein
MARDTGELNRLFNAINYLAALNVHSGHSPPLRC